MAQAKQSLEKAITPHQPKFRIVPLADINVTKNNFRTEFDDESLTELAESIRKDGVVEPLLLRDNSVVLTRMAASKGKPYDLIAGERRLRAAKIAGLKTVPAMCYDIDDETARGLMIIENLQRKDLHPLEYALGFEEMLTKRGHTVESLAQLVKRGETFIREHLHLSKLPEIAVDAFRKEDINKSVAVLIASVPDPAQREKFAKEVITGKDGYYATGHALSFRKAKALKEKEYMRSLTSAPFPVDEVIDPAWGKACVDCPHYNGNTAATGQGKRAAICLNPAHFAVVTELFGDQQQAKLEADAGDLKVIPRSEAKRLFYQNTKEGFSLTNGTNYVDKGSTFMDYADGYKNKPWAPVLAKGEVQLYAAIDGAGRIHKLALKREAEAAGVKQGHKFGYSSSSSSSTKRSAADVRAANEKKMKTAIKKLVAVEVFRQVGENARKGFAFGTAPTQTKRLLTLLRMSIADADMVCQKFICGQLGIEGIKRPQYAGSNWEKPLLQFADTGHKQNPPHKRDTWRNEFLWGLLSQVLVMEQLTCLFEEWGGNPDKDDAAVCATFGVNLRTIERQQGAALRAKRAEAQSKKKKTVKAGKRMAKAA